MRPAASRTFCTAGSSRPMRTAMMAITTSSSMRVNARRKVEDTVRSSGGTGRLRCRSAAKGEACHRAALAADGGLGRGPAHFVDNEWIARPLHRLSRLLRGGDRLAWTIETAMAWPSYVAFEHHVWHRFRRDLRAGRFDLIHRLTP